MNKLLARHIADFNSPGHTWQAHREEPGPWSTLAVVLAVLALAAVYLSR